MKPNEIIGDMQDMERILKETDRSSKAIARPTDKIIIMDKANTWARGYHNLRALPVDQRSSHPTVTMGGQTVYRPLTFAENLQARITDARAHNNRAAESPSWGIWNDSCTAIIYGPDDKFKVQKISSDLLNLDADFRQAFYQGQYGAINGEDAMEFRRNAKYGLSLTKDEVRSHPFWQFVADGNADLLREYTDLHWAGREAGYKGMAIWLRNDPQVGETRALFVYVRNYISDAFGNVSLSNYGSFLRVL